MEAARETPRASAVARACNIPYDRLQTYVADMQERGLVDPQNMFVLTPAGQAVLERYRLWRESVRLFAMDEDR